MTGCGIHAANRVVAINANHLAMNCVPLAADPIDRKVVTLSGVHEEAGCQYLQPGGSSSTDLRHVMCGGGTDVLLK
ncbi:hypothetical protein MRX96_014541 [Rhipicephalus microplus]